MTSLVGHAFNLVLHDCTAPLDRRHDHQRLEGILGQSVRLVPHYERHAEHLVELFLVADDHEGFEGFRLELVGNEVTRVGVEGQLGSRGSRGRHAGRCLEIAYIPEKPCTIR
jgi:hypothetical protein